MQLFKTPLSFLFICACLLVHAKAAPVSQDSSIHLDRRDLSFGSLVPRAERRQDKPPAAGKPTPPTAGGNGDSTHPLGKAQSPTGNAATDEKGSWSKPSTWWMKLGTDESRATQKTLRKAIRDETWKAHKLDDYKLESQRVAGGSVKTVASIEAANLLQMPKNMSMTRAHRKAHRKAYKFHSAKLDEIKASGDLGRLGEIRDHALMLEIHDRKSSSF